MAIVEEIIEEPNSIMNKNYYLFIYKLRIAYLGQMLKLWIAMKWRLVKFFYFYAKIVLRYAFGMFFVCDFKNKKDLYQKSSFDGSFLR